MNSLRHSLYCFAIVVTLIPSLTQAASPSATQHALISSIIAEKERVEKAGKEGATSKTEKTDIASMLYQQIAAAEPPEPALHLRLACYRNNRNPCPEGWGYSDYQEAVHHKQLALAAIEKIGGKQWEKYCASDEGMAKLGYTGDNYITGKRTFRGCPWPEKKLRKNIAEDMKRYPSDEADLKRASLCISSGCTDGDFSVNHPDLPKLLFDRGKRAEWKGGGDPKIWKFDGYPVSPSTAIKWYELAARQGHAGAAYMLATYHMQGRGTTADIGKAESYAEMALKNLNAGQDRIDIILGDTVSRTDLESLPAQIRMSQYAGKGLPELTSMALQLAQDGSISARELFTAGSAVLRSGQKNNAYRSEGVILLTEASNMGHAEAAWLLAVDYGRNVSSAPEKPTPNDREKNHQNYLLTEAFLEKALRNHDQWASDDKLNQLQREVASRISQNSDMAAAARRGTLTEPEQGYYAKRQHFWLRAGAEAKLPDIAIRYALQLNTDPDESAKGLYTRNKTAALAILDALPADAHQLPAFKDARLSIADPVSWQKEQEARALAQQKRDREARQAMLDRQRAEQDRQRAIAQFQRAYVETIDRYGPDTSDSGAFYYDVEVYCRYGGSRCNALRNQARAFQRANNAQAYREQMQRAWSGSGKSFDQIRADQAKAQARKRCINEAIDSIKRARGDGRSWAYSVDSCR